MVSLIFFRITCVAPLLMQNLPCPWRTFTPDVHITSIQLMTHTMKVRSVLSAIIAFPPNKHHYSVISIVRCLFNGMHYCCGGAVSVGLCISLCLIISVTTIVATSNTHRTCSSASSALRLLCLL